MSQWITPKVEGPAPRNLSSELDQIFRATQKQAGPYYELESKFGPLYNRLAVKNYGESTLGFEEDGVHVPGSLELGRMASAFQRESDVSDVETLGGRSTEAYLEANPWLRRSLGLLSDAQNQTPLLKTLNQQAEGALASGGNLSADETRDLDQQTMAKFAESGILNGNQSIGAQILNRDSAKRGRIAGAQQFATGVEGLNNIWRDFLGRSTQIDASVLNDPWMSILGRSGGGGAGGGAGMTPQYQKNFDPYNPYAQDLFNTNFNAEASRGIADAQNQAATRAAIASIASSASMASDIRAKEKIVEIGVSAVFGIPIVEFQYRAGCVPKGLRDVRYIGALADDVEEVVPEAVSVDPETGFKRVDYSMIDIEMAEITETGLRKPKRMAA